MEDKTANVLKKPKNKWDKLIEFCSKNKFLEIRNMKIRNGDLERCGRITRKYSRRIHKEQNGSTDSENTMPEKWNDFTVECAGHSGTIEILHIQDGMPVYGDLVFKEDNKLFTSEKKKI